MLKNSLFFTVAFGFAMVGCGGDKDGDTGGDTGSTTPTGDDDDDTQFIVDQIDETTLAGGVTCSGDTVSFAFGFFGDGSEAILDAMETGNATDFNASGNYWNEYHTLGVTGSSSTGQPYTDFGVSGLSTETYPWVDGVDSLFSCAANTHYDSVVMTYVLRVYGSTGTLADCAAWGDDAAGFIAGDYEKLNASEAEGELAGCAVVAAAR